MFVTVDFLGTPFHYLSYSRKLCKYKFFYGFFLSLKVFKHDLYFCICALNFWMTRSKVNGERREHSIRCLYLPHLLKKHGLIACKLSSSKTWNSFESCSDLNDVGKSCSIEVTWILYSILECFYFLATIWAQVDVLFFN